MDLVLAICLSAAPAQAQATRTWVSGVGDDANPCSRTAPCKTFAGAISKTLAGGIINCLDPGGFGAVTITKSISLVCDFTEGGVLVSGTNAIIINAPAGSIVTLKGLDIECLGTGINGIEMLNVGVVLHIHKVQIRNCRAATPGNGILIVPSSGSAKVTVADSYITDNGNGALSGGIFVKPTGSASVLLTVNRTQVEGNTQGIRIDSSTTTGTVSGAVRDSLVVGNSFNGITAASGATASTILVDHTSVVGNNFGLVGNGANASVIATYSSVTGNTTGLAANASSKLFSYKTNAVTFNNADGAFTDFIVPQ